ncbi:MAG: HEAT repeat domain-containing protein [Methanocalculus sp. MSAO_Arc1]|uniref:HEAT repeat domain-containing protein n=1 Tax=Methanocalculus TaxID=71151 RepID=UPI000FF5D91F|nr:MULTISPECIES: HEAT repeat domain-containing protein [unclassified Methanocalculus]MCP1663134.1 HEAT repeat protein [Methanocalculus sp. AMF5]RQD79343.1 MAG: HEAT repeat domain-containing protein [Methanocalculus sp. MSAO_Arc1]
MMNNTKNHTRATIEEALEILQGEEGTDVRIAAIGMLAQEAAEGNPPQVAKAALPHLIGALRDESKEVRNASTRVLASFGETALPGLAALLSDQWWVVRYRACEALGLMKRPEALPHLSAALSDEKDHVRYMAAKGLLLLGISSAVLDLRPLLEDENPYVRSMAGQAIETLQDT